MQKGGQSTLFVVIGLVIVILVVLFVLISPKRLLIDIKSYADEVTRTFEDCLKNKLSYAVANTDFVLQPDILLAKAYLERKSNGFAAECAYFPKIKGAQIIDDKAKIKSEVSFDATEFNEVTKVDVSVDYPMTIKKGEKEEKISKFFVEVSL